MWPLGGRQGRALLATKAAMNLLPVLESGEWTQTSGSQSSEVKFSQKLGFSELQMYTILRGMSALSRPEG